MKTPTAKKKAWTSPEIVDLDVENTNSASFYNPTESIITGLSCGPS